MCRSLHGRPAPSAARPRRDPGARARPGHRGAPGAPRAPRRRRGERGRARRARGGRPAGARAGGAPARGRAPADPDPGLLRRVDGRFRAARSPARAEDVPRPHAALRAGRPLRARQARAHRRRGQGVPPGPGDQRRRGAGARGRLLRRLPHPQGQDARRPAGARPRATSCSWTPSASRSRTSSR